MLPRMFASITAPNKMKIPPKAI